MILLAALSNTSSLSSLVGSLTINLLLPLPIVVTITASGSWLEMNMGLLIKEKVVCRGAGTGYCCVLRDVWLTIAPGGDSFSSFFGRGISAQIHGSISFGITSSARTLPLCQERVCITSQVSESRIPTVPLVVPIKTFLPHATSVDTWNLTSPSVCVCVCVCVCVRCVC